MVENRPSPLVAAGMVAGLVATVAAAVWLAPEANWNLLLIGLLLVFCVFSDVTAVDTPSRVLISGSFLALVVAMVLVGGTPAALLGVVTMLAGWLRWREVWSVLLNNVLTFAFFPLVGGIAFHAAVQQLGLTASDPAFYLLIFALFQFALAMRSAPPCAWRPTLSSAWQMRRRPKR